MKKYSSISELLVDYRAYHQLSQIDFAALLDIDARTVLRWEKNESLINQEKEKSIVEILGIPHQVIRNLNTENPIPIYFDLFRRIYSHTRLSQKVLISCELLLDSTIDTDRFHLISKQSDIEFVTYIQKLNKNIRPLKAELIKKAAKILPELNVVLYGQSGFYSGHITVLPLKYDTYLKIRNHEIKEGDLKTNDLEIDLSGNPLVFYYYSVYADSAENYYYILNRLLTFFQRNKFKNYIFAGISYRKPKIEFLLEIGLDNIWEEPIEEGGKDMASFMEGNFDEYLFGNESGL
jgi:transcriptional regulator with XRE-family HTH domain